LEPKVLQPKSLQILDIDLPPNLKKIGFPLAERFANSHSTRYICQFAIGRLKLTRGSMIYFVELQMPLSRGFWDAPDELMKDVLLEMVSSLLVTKGLIGYFCKQILAL